MSLRDAIRDAVDERNKQSGSDAATESLDVMSDAQAEVIHAEPLATEDAPRKSTKARAPKNQPTVKADKALTTRPTEQRVEVQEPASQIQETNTASSKAVNIASSKAVNAASSKAADEIPAEGSTSDGEVENIETAALTVRVPRSHRIHWLISAKKERTSLTAAITEALNARFGEPTD